MFKHFFNALDILEKSGSVDSAFQYADTLESQWDHDDTMKKLAKYFARQGRISETSRFTAAIRDQISHIHCLHEVARALRRKGYVDPGRRFLQDAYEKVGLLNADPMDTAVLFLVMSSELYDAGRAEEALTLLRRAMELADAAPGSAGASKFIAGCSGQLASWNHAEEAKRVAEAIPEKWFRDVALKRLDKSAS